MKKALVTGGAGFVGSNLVDKLIDMDVEVVILDNLSTGNINNVNKKADFRCCFSYSCQCKGSAFNRRPNIF